MTRWHDSGARGPRDISASYALASMPVMATFFPCSECITMPHYSSMNSEYYLGSFRSPALGACSCESIARLDARAWGRKCAADVCILRKLCDNISLNISAGRRCKSPRRGYLALHDTSMAPEMKTLVRRIAQREQVTESALVEQLLEAVLHRARL